MTAKLEKMFPLWSIKNIRLYYILSILNNCWFLTSNWIFFWTKFMTYGQLGLVEAFAFTFGLIMEIPSGAIADMIGKRKTIILAMLLASAGFLILSQANGETALLIGFLMAQAGWAFYSGAAEALAYDSLIEVKKAGGYEKVSSTTGAIITTTTIATTFLGGVMYLLHFRSTHLAMGISYLVAFFVALRLVEPKVDTDKFSFSGYVLQLKLGVQQLFIPVLRPFLLLIFILAGVIYAYDWGLIRQAMAEQFGFGPVIQGTIFALMGIMGAAILHFLPPLRKRISDKRGLYGLTLITALGFIMAFFRLGYWGLIPMLIIEISSVLTYPWISIVVNKYIDSRYRATALSAVALITKIPYIFLSIIVGGMIERGQFGWFNWGVGVVIIVAVLASMVIQKQR